MKKKKRTFPVCGYGWGTLECGVQPHYLETLPGKPRCTVASRCPMSIPNSSAFVAATPRILPPNKSDSIFLLSCNHLGLMSTQHRSYWIADNQQSSIFSCSFISPQLRIAITTV